MNECGPVGVVWPVGLTGNWPDLAAEREMFAAAARGAALCCARRLASQTGAALRAAFM